VVISKIAGNEEKLRGESSNTALSTNTTVMQMLKAIKMSNNTGDMGITIMTITSRMKHPPTTSDRFDANLAKEFSELIIETSP
jgi:hypothetical protein